MVTEVTEVTISKEEFLEEHKKYQAELFAIERAIALGILKEGPRGLLSEKKIAKIRSLVDSALDALPWGHGLQALTPAELEFAEKFAHILADKMRSKK